MQKQSPEYTTAWKSIHIFTYLMYDYTFSPLGKQMLRIITLTTFEVSSKIWRVFKKNPLINMLISLALQKCNL